MTKPKARITDVDAKPPRLIDSNDIAGDVERFLAAGGRIDRPAFRRDQIEKYVDVNRTVRRRWNDTLTPPDVREFKKRGGSRK